MEHPRPDEDVAIPIAVDIAHATNHVAGVADRPVSSNAKTLC